MSVKTLGAGFLMSFITLLFLVINPILVFLSLFTYIVSIVLRGVGWNKLKNLTGEDFYMYVGVVVILLGFSFIALLFMGPIIERSIIKIDGSAAIMALIVWIAYSIMEWFAYIKLYRRGIRVFALSAISIIGMVLIAYLAFSLHGVGLGGILTIFIFFRVGLLFLLISSLISSIGFFRLSEYDLIEGEDTSILYR